MHLSLPFPLAFLASRSFLLGKNLHLPCSSLFSLFFSLLTRLFHLDLEPLRSAPVALSSPPPVLCKLFTYARKERSQVVALSVCVPFDIIKSRMQVSGRSRLLVDSITAMSQAQDPLHERRIARTVHGTTGASSEGLHPSSSSASAAADASHKGASSPSSTPAYRYRNTGHALQDIVRTDGFRGLYRGFGATLLRDGPWSALQFCFYESARSLLQNSADHELQVSSGKEVSLPAWKGLLAGLMAGAGAAICTTPLDTIKTRLQTQQNAEGMAGEYRYAGISDAFRTIVREEGVRGGLFRGIMPRIYYIAPFTAVAFACLESFKTFFGAL